MTAREARDELRRCGLSSIAMDVSAKGSLAVKTYVLSALAAVVVATAGFASAASALPASQMTGVSASNDNVTQARMTKKQMMMMKKKKMMMHHKKMM
jgi:hypothetical protein